MKPILGSAAGIQVFFDLAPDLAERDAEHA